MSKREKIILGCVLAVLALFLVDKYLLTPLQDEESQLEVESGRIAADIGRAKNLQDQRRELEPKWRVLRAKGLKGDPAEAEGQLLHALADWSKEAGCALSSLKPDRPESKGQLKEIQVEVVGSGPLDSIVQLLWKMRSASFPLKITELQLGSRNDGTSDMSLQAKLSTLYTLPESRIATAAKAGGGGSK